MDNKISLDKIRGMFMGVFLGDSLGCSREFNNSCPYTGRLDHQTIVNTRFQGRKELLPGQVTDDSELTLALLRQIIIDKGYNRDNVIMAYLKWANSGLWMMGHNTKSLFKGVTTIRGYKERMNNKINKGEISKSNGSLMRCSPLALIANNDILIQDINITNPNNVNRDCGLCYITALRLAFLNYNPEDIYNYIKSVAQTNEVKEVFYQIDNQLYRNLSINKGYVCHGFYCAMKCMKMDFNDAMRWIITQPSTDTDTNACIAGALLGAIYGFDKLKSDPDTEYNINKVINCDSSIGPTPRPKEYSPHDFYQLTETLYQLLS